MVGEKVAKIVRSINIDVPPDKVFAYVQDLENMPEWMSSCKSHRITSHQRSGVGTTTHCVMEQAGRIIEWDSVVTEYVKNQKMMWHCEKPSRNDGIFEFEPTTTGTKVTFTMDYDLPYSILGAIIDRLKVSRSIQQAIDDGLRRLKEILEQ